MTDDAFFEAMFARLGLPSGAYRKATGGAASGPTLEVMARALVLDGVYYPSGGVSEGYCVDELCASGAPAQLCNELERLRPEVNSLDGWVRLGRLYAACGRFERTTLCFRLAFAELKGVSPELLLALGEGLVGDGGAAIARACVDRVAELLLTGDRPLDSPERPNSAPGPNETARYLDRAAVAALKGNEAGRAASLGRAATALYERCRLRRNLSEALAHLSAALAAEGDLRAAFKVGDRRRILVTAQDDYEAVARCQLELATLAEDYGDVGRLQSCLESAYACFDSLEAQEEAYEVALRLGASHLESGSIDAAAEALGRALGQAAPATLREAVARVGLSEVWRTAGQLSTATRERRLAAEIYEACNEASEAAKVWGQIGRQGYMLAQQEQLSEVRGKLCDLVAPCWEMDSLEALRAVSEGRDDDARRGLLDACWGATNEGQDDLAAEFLLSAALGVERPFATAWQTFFAKAVRRVKPTCPIVAARLECLRSAADDDLAGGERVFEQASALEHALARLEAAESLCWLLYARGEGQRSLRALSSTLRTLTEIFGRLDEADAESFATSSLVGRILELAERVRACLVMDEEVVIEEGKADTEETLRLSPVALIDNLVNLLKRRAPRDLPVGGGDAALNLDGNTTRLVRRTMDVEVAGEGLGPDIATRVISTHSSIEVVDPRGPQERPEGGDR